jgi:hypothetical protein
MIQMETLPLYPKSRIAIYDSYSIVAMWGLLFLALLCGISVSLGVEFLAPVGRLFWKLMLFTLLLHIFLAVAHKCPNCGKHPTIQGFKKDHPNCIGRSRLSGWGGVAMSIFIRGRFVCIHCGSRFSVMEGSKNW